MKEADQAATKRGEALWPDNPPEEQLCGQTCGPCPPRRSFVGRKRKPQSSRFGRSDVPLQGSGDK